VNWQIKSLKTAPRLDTVLGRGRTPGHGLAAFQARNGTAIPVALIPSTLCLLQIRSGPGFARDTPQVPFALVPTRSPDQRFFRPAQVRPSPLF
jgi:hypothetical protein